jgi:hypothetical protein
MKRFLLILGLMCFLFDLVDIGFVDYAKHVDHEYPCASVHQQSFDKPSKTFARKLSAIALLPTFLVDANDRFQCQLAAEEIPYPYKIVYCYHFFSSGGIPS